MYCNHSHSQAGSENAVTKCTIYFIREHYDATLMGVQERKITRLPLHRPE